MQRGLVIEQKRGMLAQTPGVLQQFSARLATGDLLQPFIVMMNQLERIGTVEIGEHAPH